MHRASPHGNAPRPTSPWGCACAVPLWSLAAALVLPAVAWAQGSFPRGPGLYFSPVKIFIVVTIYLLWVRACWWVDHDAESLKLQVVRWNGLMLASGMIGLLTIWVLPWFAVSVILLAALVVAPLIAYVGVRNDAVGEEERVLTPHHFRTLARRYLNFRKAGPEGEGKPLIPIRFIGKSDRADKEGQSRVVRAQESRGYQAALEMVHEAIERRATDIHLEPTRDEMLVRFRIDGILQSESPFTRALGDAVLNIFKVLADLDIAEKRKPQDGSFSAEVCSSREPPRKPARDEEEDEDAPLRLAEEDPAPAAPVSRLIDFRVATAGSVAGEKLVMRILDRSRQLINLGQLGMRPRMREQVHRIVTQPHGMFIVCGPTGSGKSTTLYAGLSEIDRFQKNVITVEDPVEYRIDNVTQIEIHTRAGKTFASELRSILRQDPDVIYIGEIRDAETAEIACQAAQTGHMVFTTLHANDTIGAIARLLDLGVKPFLVSSAVSAVLGQRLVRLLCPECKEAYRPAEELLRRANLPAEKIRNFYRVPEKRQRSCSYCGNTGYRGRTGIFEILVLNDRMRELIRDQPNLTALKQEAIRGGMTLLQEDGLHQVIKGQTSVQELLRVSK